MCMQMEREGVGGGRAGSVLGGAENWFGAPLGQDWSYPYLYS